MVEMTEHLAELIRNWFKGYLERGEKLKSSHAFHVWLLGQDAKRRAEAATRSSEDDSSPDQ